MKRLLHWIGCKLFALNYKQLNEHRRVILESLTDSYPDLSQMERLILTEAMLAVTKGKWNHSLASLRNHNITLMVFREYLKLVNEGKKPILANMWFKAHITNK